MMAVGTGHRKGFETIVFRTLQGLRTNPLLADQLTELAHDLRIPVLLLGMLALFAWQPVATAAQRVAVFDFELIDTSLDGETYGTRPDEKERLKKLSDSCARPLPSLANLRSSISVLSKPLRMERTCRLAAAAMERSRRK